MKYKNLVRNFGVLETVAGGFGAYIEANQLLNIDYSKFHEFMISEVPTNYKITASVVVLGMGILLPIAGAFCLDGMTTIKKGVPFYGILKGLEKITKNQKKKEKITNEIKRFLDMKEKEIL